MRAYRTPSAVTSGLPGSTLAPVAQALPWLVLLFVSLMASGTFAIIKYLTGYVGAVELFLLRFLPTSVAALLLLLLFYRDAIKPVLRGFWWFFLIREAMAVFGFHFTLIYAETVLPAGIAAIIVGTWPVITILLASFTLGERITTKKIAGALVAFAGVAAVIALGTVEQAAQLDIAPSQWVRYSLLLLIAPVSASVVTVVSRWYLNRGDGNEHPDSFLFTLICRSPSGLYAIAAYLVFHPPVPITDVVRDVPPLFWFLVAVLALYNSLFGLWLWNWVLQRMQAGNMSTFIYLQTLFALVIAAVALDESLDALKIIGALAIVAGVLIANIDEILRKAPPMGSGRMRIPPPPAS